MARLVDNWNNGRITTNALISAVRKMLPQYLSDQTLKTVEPIFYIELADELNLLRTEGEWLSSSLELLKLVGKVLAAIYQEQTIPVPPDVQELLALRPRWGYDYDSSSEQRFVAFRATTAGVSSVDLIIPSAADREILRAELSSLGVFAVLPDHFSPSELNLARLLALRLFGGLSLEDIARREGRTVELIQQEWQQTHSWINSASAPAKDFVSSAFLDILDYHVLRVIAKNPDLLHAVEWRTFERIMAGVLEELGYTIELRQGTKDGGIDVIAVKSNDNFGGHRYLIQAKRWRKRVGVQPVRELLFLKQKFGATKVCLATTSRFTKGAWLLADEYRWELELRDFERLQEWLTEAVARGEHRLTPLTS